MIGRKDSELPQKNSIFRDFDIDSLLHFTSNMLGLNLKFTCMAKRVSADDKDKHDLLVYYCGKQDAFQTEKSEIVSD